jgi:hypothetical protein
MKANLQWIEQEWRKWLITERGKKITGTSAVKEHPEHIAKLFAAHCLEALHTEVEVMNALDGERN